MKRHLTLIVVAVGLAGCDGGSSAPSGPDPDPGPAAIAIAWDGRTVDWGAPAPLTAAVQADSSAEVVWRSLDDIYRNLPVILGTGRSITTAALRPGTTRVEAVVLAGDVPLASDTVQVTVRYRESWNVELLAQVPFPNGTVGDVWVDGGRAHVARRPAGGISIVSLDGNVTEVGRFAPEGQFTQDIKVADGIAYVSHEPVHGFTTYPFSVTIVDVSNPVSPVVLGGVPTDVAPSAHNLWLDGNLLTVAASGTDFSVFDVSDAARPRFLSRIDPAPATAHDAHVSGGLLFGSSMGFDGNRGRLTVASLTDPENPVVMGGVAFGTLAFTHSSWLSADGRYLYVAEENLNAPIRIFDVSSPGTPLFVGAYQPRLGTIPHNFQVSDGLAYLSHYKHGIEVVDVSDPTRPRLVGFYDTHPGADEEPAGLAPAHDDKGQDSFQGVWGVHWTDDGRIVASDMNRGLFVFRFTGPGD